MLRPRLYKSATCFKRFKQCTKLLSILHQDAVRTGGENEQCPTRSTNKTLLNDMIENANRHGGQIDPATGERCMKGLAWMHTHMQELAIVDVTLSYS